MTNIDKQIQMANAIRFLTIDSVEKAQSGHPGMPMGAADIVTSLYTHFMQHVPSDPNWPNRDRFILSAGHGSMLLYSVLYLTGYSDITIREIENFRQLGSRTAGHPEYGHAAGIETTTGPLGQGFANGVGMAIAECMMRARYGSELINHHTYVLVGDGCLMEGISQEALSLAGHLKLHKLIVLWDDNQVTIDGPLSLTDSTDQCARFSASGWNVLTVDGNNPISLNEALQKAKNSSLPTFIACKTTIGFGCQSKSGTNKAHGSPLGAKNIEAMRTSFNWPPAPFETPKHILEDWRNAGKRSENVYKKWQTHFDALSLPEQESLQRLWQNDLPSDFEEIFTLFKNSFIDNPVNVATRKASELALEKINALLFETIGGSADLTASNNTITSQLQAFTSENSSGRYVYYGIREHAMSAIMNGLALYGGFIPYSGTFLCFSDYMKPAMRLSSLMGIRVIYVLTHDSIGLGEDGPTHQPVEQLASLRAMPNHNVFRPADIIETIECWQIALQSKKNPSSLALTRQSLPMVRHEKMETNLCALGAYELSPSPSNQDSVVTIFATGSEVSIAINAQTLLERDGISTRVVSVPCFELFKKQSNLYRKELIGNSRVKIAVEAGVRQGWDEFIERNDIFIGMHGFGASGPIHDLYQHFGITAEHIVVSAKNKLNFN